jgi:hypothetical protein
MAAGNKHLRYKDALNDIEVASPGSKADFYFGFLRNAAERFRTGPMSDDPADDGIALVACQQCGAPTTTEVCAFCRLVERAGGRQPVTLQSRREGAMRDRGTVGS